MAGTITPNDLRRLLTFDPETGVLRWRMDVARNVKTGDIAGKAGKKKYLQICTNGQTVLAHRAAWAIVHGRWPSVLIDHINGNAHDNRLCNLREATYSQNSANRPTWKTSRSGVKGVRRRNGAWVVRAERSGETRYGGRFQCLGRAAVAYRQISQELFGEFAYGGAK